MLLGPWYKDLTPAMLSQRSITNVNIYTISPMVRYFTVFHVITVTIKSTSQIVSSFQRFNNIDKNVSIIHQKLPSIQHKVDALQQCEILTQSEEVHELIAQIQNQYEQYLRYVWDST